MELVDHPAERRLRPLWLELLGDLLQLVLVQFFVAVGIRQILSRFDGAFPPEAEKITQSGLEFG